jgi:ubiquinone/menaquinone biosynthesis C-methylase UbiE
MPEIKLTFDAADDYDRFMGRWSRAIGERFLAWLDAPAAKRWLDVGCGTGAFSELILRSAKPAALTGIDPSPQQIDFVRKRLPAHTFEVADAATMPFGDGAFDVIASALVLHFIPDRHKAFAEMKRVLEPGGLVSGYTWRRTAESDMAAYWPMMRGAEAVGGQALRSAVVPEGTQDGMRASLAAAGFSDIETTEIEVSQTYVSFDDYWEAQTRPSSPPGRTVAALDERQRTKMRDMLRASMPAADGTVTYSSVAIAGKARKP